MTTSKALGIAFAGIATVVAIGAVLLTGANASQIGPRPVILDILGLGWLFLLWGGFVTISVFLIAWVAEAMRASQEATLSPEVHGGKSSSSTPSRKRSSVAA
jgi:hypothetical protein